MYRPKKDYVIIVLGCILFLLGGIAIGLRLKGDKVLESNVEISINDNTKEKDLNTSSTNTSKSDDNVNTSTSKDINTNTVSTNNNISSSSTNDTNTSTTVGYSDKDITVIDTFTSTLEDINSSDTNASFKVKAKGTFVSIIDFLFYDGSINGITFKELTDKGKEKVLELASKIDDTIESKIPGYKESIASGCSSAFNAMSKLIKKGATNVNEFLISNLDEDDYTSVINAKDELVLYTKNAFSFMRDVGSNIVNSTIDSLNDWYLEWKNK